MSSQSVMRTLAGASALVLSLMMGHQALAVQIDYDLSDHPDGAINPPGYGLRLDGLYYHDRRFTFSFNHAQSNVKLTADFNESDPNDGSASLTISGQIYGGWDTGSSWDTNDQVLWDFHFVYDDNVVITGDGSTGNPYVYKVMNGANAVGTNTGHLRATEDGGDSTIHEGDRFFLADKSDSSGLFFEFDPDEYRLRTPNTKGVDHCNVNPDYCDMHVARGWYTITGSDNTEEAWREPYFKNSLSKTRDILALGETDHVGVPEPASLALFGLGLAGLGAMRRRKTV